MNGLWALWRGFWHLLQPLRQRYPWFEQFVRFGCVGVVGLGADFAVLELMTRGAGWDAYSGRIVSYIAAATVTWALNRWFTFKGQGSGSMLRQWARFLLANLTGFVANYATYAACIYFIPVTADYKILALIPASLAGMVFNFVASKKLVFK